MLARHTQTHTHTQTQTQRSGARTFHWAPVVFGAQSERAIIGALLCYTMDNLTFTMDLDEWNDEREGKRERNKTSSIRLKLMTSCFAF